jgi:hypothetical protein
VSTEAAAPWLTIVTPAVFMDWCAECGAKFRKGGKAQRINGGYGYRCEDCGRRPDPPAPVTPEGEHHG